MHDHHHPHDHHHHPHHGHNSSDAAQWQTPHLPEGEAPPVSPEAQDLDLVELAFFNGFLAAEDPTSFIRLSGIPFEATDGDGQRLVLLRVEQQATTDLGSVTPYLGGEDFSYHPLPAKLTSKRSEVRFIFSTGSSTRALSFSEARALS